MNERARLSALLGEVFRLRNFRLLWGGQALALLGEQINLIALAWLALQITGDAFALGSVLAVMGIPPAILMLVGGASTDRFSPRSLMLVVDGIRLALVVGLVLLVLTSLANLWVLYSVALGFGLLSAFSIPAVGSIVPTLVPDRSLQAANSFFQSLTQLAAFAGPAVGGILIASVGNAAIQTQAPATTPGLALAFGIYAFGLLVSMLTLAMMRPSSQGQPWERRENSKWLSAMGAGFSYARRDPMLRLLIPVILALNLLLAGPLAVGIPVLSKLRLPEGAAAFGLILSGFGGGNLLGNLLAGVVRRSKGLGLVLTAVFFCFGAGLGVMGWVRSLWVAFLILFLLGTGNGYLGIIVRTMLQRRTPRDLLGRVMGLYFFARAALVPVSQAASGAIIDQSLEGLFLISGVLLILVSLGVALSPLPQMFELQVELARREIET